MKTPTDLQLVQAHIDLKREIAAAEAVLENALKPKRNAMQWIEEEFLRRFMERGSDNSKTDAGTAYKSVITSYKVVDENAFLTFCTQYPECREMMTIKPVKDPIKTFMNGSKELPPGLEQSGYTNVNIRRT
jgi:hypothetical protein